MLSFDVKSFFANVPLEMTTDVIVRKTYLNNEIKRSATKEEIRSFFILVINQRSTSKKYRVTCLLAGVLLVELERPAIPNLTTISLRRRYDNDTI